MHWYRVGKGDSEISSEMKASNLNDSNKELNELNDLNKDDLDINTKHNTRNVAVIKVLDTLLQLCTLHKTQRPKSIQIHTRNTKIKGT